MKLKKLSSGGIIFIIIFVMLAAALAFGSLRVPFNTSAFSVSAEKLSGFTYEIAGGESGAASFPHKLNNLAPRSHVTVYTDVEPGRYESLLIKTVYTSLRLYADDELIYECGKTESYPAWMLDPPTLLKIVPLPESTSHLRFEYVSPSQRSAMSLPEIWAGDDGTLLTGIFKANGALLVMSLFFLLLGMAALLASLLLRRKNNMFVYLGLFAIATGCWSFGECNATAFLMPYPTLLYLMAFGGLFTLSIPLLHYGSLILKPQNEKPIKLAEVILKSAVMIAFVLQLTGIMSLSKTMYVFHVIVPLNLAVFAAVTAWEYYRYSNKMAKRFVLPAIVLALSSVMEVVNYNLHFTRVISLFFMSGAIIFTLMLGFIGVQFMLEKQRENEELAAKADFFRRMNHALRTPLTVVSTNIQTARRRPEEANELLTQSQAEIMKMAGMIDEAMQDDEEEARL